KSIEEVVAVMVEKKLSQNLPLLRLLQFKSLTIPKNDNENKDNNDNINIKNSDNDHYIANSENEEKNPETFRKMTNAFIIERLKILIMANQIYSALSILLNLPFINESAEIEKSKIIMDEEKVQTQL
ncbi:8597_t:CDS:2, partial [Funneliformis caledonium]